MVSNTPSKPKEIVPYYDTVKVEIQTVKVIYDTVKIKQFIKIPVDTNIKNQ
jgi:hypothetical protein